MKKTLLFLSLGILMFSFVFVYASEFSGDGTYTVSKGDIITIDNGWKIEVLTVGLGPAGETINFRLYSPDGQAYPSAPYQSSLQKIQGRQKFGTDEVLKVEMEILEVSGAELNRAGVSWVEKEHAKINVVSIDEKLPGAVSGGTDENFTDINKELTYKDGVETSMKVGDEKTLANGYTLKLDSFGRFGPSFSIYDGNNLIDEGIQVGEGVGFFGGSYIYLENFDDTKVYLKIIDGSDILFGTGWNLFSIPVEDGDGFGTILESTCNEATIWRWDSEKEDYEAVGKLAEGTKIPANEGLWVKIQTKKNVVSDNDCEIIVSGDKSVSVEGQKLKAGWNLIGSPISSYGQREVFEDGSNFNLLGFDDILGDCRIEKGPWQYLATDLVQVGQGSDLTDTNKYTQPFNNKLRLGRGYFIKVIDDCTLG